MCKIKDLYLILDIKFNCHLFSSVYLNTQGVNPKTHNIKTELVRITLSNICCYIILRFIGTSAEIHA